MSVQELEKRITGNERALDFEVDGKKYHSPGRPYALFPIGGDVEVGYGKFRISLQSDNYGFQNTELTEKLENVAKQANDSIEYDVEMVLNNESFPEKFRDRDRQTWNHRKRDPGAHLYQPLQHFAGLRIVDKDKFCFRIDGHFSYNILFNNK